MNLAAEARHAPVRERLLKALADWQEATADPFADPAKLKTYLAEMDAVMVKKINYRRKKGFRWQYLDYLRPDGA